MSGPQTSPLRIVHCLRAPIGGIFRHVADLAIAQAKMGHEVGIVCDSLTGGAFEADHIARISPELPLGVRRVPMRRQLSAADFKASYDIFREIRALKPDVLHGHGAKGGAFVRTIGTALRVTGRRPLRIYCPHGGSLHYDPDTLAGSVYFRLERAMQRVTDGFVFVSDYEENCYRNKVALPYRPVRRVYNGLLPHEFEPVEPREGAADLMFLGMMRDLKGPQVLIEALAVLRGRGIRPTVAFHGAGDDRARYEARVAELRLEEVSFSDPRPTREALAAGRVLVLPSLAESMPYVILEAGAAGIPIIASDVGGLPEILGADSPCLVQPGDAEGLADAIEDALSDPAIAAARAKRIRTDIAARFSLGRMADEITQFYADLEAARTANRRGPAPSTRSHKHAAAGERR